MAAVAASLAVTPASAVPELVTDVFETLLVIGPDRVATGIWAEGSTTGTSRAQRRRVGTPIASRQVNGMAGVGGGVASVEYGGRISPA